MKLYKLAIFVFVLGIWQNVRAQDYIVVNPGSTVHLLAEPDEYPEYVWFHDGQMIPGESTATLAATMEGWYSVFALNAGGCPSDFSDEFQVIFDSPNLGPEDQVFCANSYITISDIVVNGEIYVWYTAPTGGFPLPPDHVISAGVYYAVQVINGVESSMRFEVAISMIDCSDLLFVSKETNNLYPDVGHIIVFTVKVYNNATVAVTDIVVREKLPSGYSYISSQADLGMYNPVSGIWVIPEIPSGQHATLQITAEVLKNGDYKNIACVVSSVPDDPDNDDCAEQEVFPTCLLVYNEFSPNDDGQNEVFKIRCIEDYDNNRLQVYNRWGNLVYEKSPYRNDWDGTANKGSATVEKGKKLPEGTYFYSLELGNGRRPLIGWLYIAGE